jgi:hypothetical protein
MSRLDRDRTAVAATGGTTRERRRPASVASPPLGRWSDA